MIRRAIIVGAASVALTACGETIEVGTPPPPAEYLSCQAMPTAPDLEPLGAIEAPAGVMAYRKAETDARDGQIARYIIALRGAWFDCSNALQRVSDYYEAAE